MSTDWMWCHENPKAAAAKIDMLREALAAAVDALETLRRGHGAEVSGLCFPALNVGRDALENRVQARPTAKLPR